MAALLMEERFLDHRFRSALAVSYGRFTFSSFRSLQLSRKFLVLFSTSNHEGLVVPALSIYLPRFGII